MLFLKVQKPKPSSKKQVHGENSSEGKKTVQVAGQVTNGRDGAGLEADHGPAVTHSALTEVENSLGGLGRWQGGSHRWLSRLCLSQPHPGNQNWSRVDRTPVTPTLGACTDARVGWVTAPLTPHTTQGTDMDADTSKAKPQPWPPSPEAPVWVQGKPEHCCPGNRATWSSRLGQHR